MPTIRSRLLQISPVPATQERGRWRGGSVPASLLVVGLLGLTPRITSAQATGTNVVFRAGANLDGVRGGASSIADVDGTQDLLIAGQNKNSTASTTLYLGNGDGTFSTAGKARVVDLSAADLSSGVYFLRLQAGQRRATRRVTVIR